MLIFPCYLLILSTGSPKNKFKTKSIPIPIPTAELDDKTLPKTAFFSGSPATNKSPGSSTMMYSAKSSGTKSRTTDDTSSTVSSIPSIDSSEIDSVTEHKQINGSVCAKFCQESSESSIFGGGTTDRSISFFIESALGLKESSLSEHEERGILAHLLSNCIREQFGEHDFSKAAADSQFPFDLKKRNTYVYGESPIVTPIEVDCSAREDREAGFVQMRTNSFVSPRTNSRGVIGPDALFGRFKISVTMSRSLGGRYGPRRCIPLPDIISLDVPRMSVAKCVLASDGLWDIVSLASIAKVLKKFPDPTMAAQALCNKAYRRRHEKGYRLDDITVIVLVISPV